MTPVTLAEGAKAAAVYAIEPPRAVAVDDVSFRIDLRYEDRW